MTIRRCIIAVSALMLMGCAGEFSGPRPPSQAEQLCKSWGYAPNDPVCLNSFHSTGGQ